MRCLRPQGLVVVLAAFGLVGCTGQSDASRPQLVPVSGKVTYQAQPVEGAIISFMTDASPRTATGQTDAKGEYQLTTYNSNDGAVIGEHTVTITKPQAAQQAEPMDARGYAGAMAGGKGGKTGIPTAGQEVKQTLPAKYASAQTSGLKRAVIAGDVNRFEFDLTD